MFSINNGIPVLKIANGCKDKKKIIRYESEMKKGGYHNITTKGTFQLVPTNKERDTVFIVGRSGSGKSTFAANFAKQYQLKHKDNPILLVSPKQDDPAFDGLNLSRIKLDNNTFIDDKITVDEVSDSLIIFDDIEGISDDDIRKEVYKFRDDILVLGRSKKVSCMAISHLMTKGVETRIPLTESEFVVFFPGGGLLQQITRFLKIYLGLDKAKISKILDIQSRWVCIHTFAPLFVISEHEAFML